MAQGDSHSAEAPLLSAIGDGAPLEELDHEESTFEAPTPVRVVAPISAATTFHIARKPVGVLRTKIETLGSE